MPRVDEIDDLRRLSEDEGVSIRPRDLLRIKIAEDVKAFIEAGGVITQINNGFSGSFDENGKFIASPFRLHSDEQEKRRK